MLTQIKLQNFQNHTKSTLDLDNGVNVISGDSDSGKTAIFRAVNWVLSNRPSGEPFRPWSAKPKDITEVTLVFDNGKITRRKSNTIDEYVLEEPGKKPLKFETLNRSVPEEVSNFINLADYSTQWQSDDRGVKKPFFIGESGAEKAKLLNNICGLDIIDSTLSNVNSLIRENTAEQKRLEKDIKDLNTKIEKIQFIDEADTLLVQIETMFSKNEQLKLVNDKLNKYILELTQVQDEINTLDTFLLVKEKWNNLNVVIENYSKTESENKYLQKYVSDINELQEVIESNTEFLKSKETVKKITGLIQEYKTLRDKVNIVEKHVTSLCDVEETISHTRVWLEVKTRYKSVTELITGYYKYSFEADWLKDWVNDINKNKSLIKSLNTKVDSLREKKKTFLKDIGECPLCGSRI